MSIVSSGVCVDNVERFSLCSFRRLEYNSVFRLRTAPQRGVCDEDASCRADKKTPRRPHTSVYSRGCVRVLKASFARALPLVAVEIFARSPTAGALSLGVEQKREKANYKLYIRACASARVGNALISRLHSRLYASRRSFCADSYLRSERERGEVRVASASTAEYCTVQY